MEIALGKDHSRSAAMEKRINALNDFLRRLVTTPTNSRARDES